MRWLIKEKEKRESGDTRTVKLFLWFPLRIDNEVRWLEWAKIEQVYIESFTIFPWCNYRWV